MNSSLTHWREQPSLSRLSHDIFDDFFNAPLFLNTWKSPSKNVKVTKTDAAHNILVAAPGLDKGDFNVELKESVLTVSYNASKESENSFVQQTFERSWRVPEGTKPKDITAEYKSGVLNVAVNRREDPPPTVETIKVK